MVMPEDDGIYLTSQFVTI